VERPQDLAKKADGIIVKLDKSTIHGKGTKFTSQCHLGDTLLIPGFPELVVTKVNSDEQLEFKSEERPPGKMIPREGLGFKVQPKVDQTTLFESVWEALKNGDSIGIFPEGGSHDRTKLLPLKAGICIMALGAAAKH
jgi:glycerol-3-phosphate O-acyltransferase/dihydroxyacetone phosphate acyltransferase